MVAAKEKTLSFKSHSHIQRMDNESAHPTAAKTPSTVVNRISSYDFTTRKFSKPPIGTSEKIHLIVAVEPTTKPRKYTGENALQLRRLHWAPEMSLYRGYFVPGGMDPEGLNEFEDLVDSCCPCNYGQRKCVVKSGPTYDPVGPLTPEVLRDGRKRSPEFKRTAEFEQDPDLGICATCCEVRQNMKWETDADRPNHPGFRPAADYDADTWYRDRAGSGWMCGSRTQPGRPNCRYIGSDGEDMLCGTKFEGTDQPVDGSGKKTGWWKFQLVVVDRCNGNEIVATSDELILQW